MSEIVLSNPSNQYVAEYPTGSVVPNFDPAMVQQKSNSSTTSSPPNAYEETSQQTYGAYPGMYSRRLFYFYFLTLCGRSSTFI